MNPLITIFLFLPLISLAQPDTVFYRPDRPITWEDFQAEPPANPGNHAAEISSGMGISYQTSSADGGTAAFQMNTYMIPARSWVKPGSKNEAILAHEQLHFDITYYHSQLLEVELNELGYKPNLQKIVQRKVKATYQQMNAMQNRYDRETLGGLDEEAQEKWEQKVQNLLESLD